jgi:triacylglycerol lipase
MFGFAIGFVLWTAVLAAPASKSSPTVKVRNGTYTGVHSSTYNQDFFLGMPYAQQPVGNLRFTVPQSLNTSWEGARDAKAYSDICVGYGVSILLYLFYGASLILGTDRLYLVSSIRSVPDTECHQRFICQEEFEASRWGLDSWWWILYGLWIR